MSTAHARKKGVYLLVNGQTVGHAQILYPEDSSHPSTELHGTSLREFQKADEKLIVVNQVQIYKEAFKIPYPYNFKSFDDIPNSLGDMNNMAFYKTSIAWDERQMKRNENASCLPSKPRDVYRSSMRTKKISAGCDTEHAMVDRDVRSSQDNSQSKNAPIRSLQWSRRESGENQIPRKRRKIDSLQNNPEDSTEDDSIEDEEYIPYEHDLDIRSHEQECEVLSSLDDDYQLHSTRKRQYRFRNRKRGNKVQLSAFRSARIAEAQRKENRFLIKRYCCASRRCFEEVDPNYSFEQYKAILVMDSRRVRLKLESMLDTTTMEFYFDERPVCYRFLCIGLKFSFYMISNVKGTPRSRPPPGLLPRENKKMSKRDSILVFLRNYANTMGDRMPNTSVTNLPVIEQIDLYEPYVQYYREHHAERIQEMPPTKSYFLRVWKDGLRNVKVRKTHGFAKCSLCEKYRSELLQCNGNDSKIKAIQEGKSNHLQFIRRERLGYYLRRDRTVSAPRRYCSFIIDGADQKSYGIPHFTFSTKSDKGHKMKIKCVGVLEHLIEKKVSLFPMTEEFATGANHVIEALHRVLDTKFHEEGKLPPSMYIQLDSCSRENKNHYLLSYLEWLVGLGVFNDIQASFLPVGHTHEDIDQAFSSLARHLRTTDAFTLNDLMEEMRNTCRKGATVAQMNNLTNYSGLCDSEKCIRKVRGLTQYRYFRFTRASRGDGLSKQRFETNCHVKRGIDDDWKPLHSENNSGFLIHLPNIRNAPPTETNPPENAQHVLRCFDAAEERIKSRSKMRELRELHARVYTKRSDPMHWNLNEMFELRARVGEEEADDLDDGSELENMDNWADEEDEDESCDDEDKGFEYNAGSFVAVSASDSAPFWIGKIQRFFKKKETLKVLWYEGYPVKGNSSSYEDVYRPINNGIDTITTDTVHLNFDRLTSSGTLRVNVVKALRQVLATE